MNNLPESFKVYKQKVTVTIDGKEVVYELYPLSGAFYGDFTEVLGALPQGEEEGKGMFDTLTKPITNKIHMLLVQMFKTSYDITDAEEFKQLDMSISKNLFNLIPALMEVNLPKVEDAKE